MWRIKRGNWFAAFIGIFKTRILGTMVVRVGYGGNYGACCIFDQSVSPYPSVSFHVYRGQAHPPVCDNLGR